MRVAFEDWPPPLEVRLKTWQLIIQELLRTGGKNLTNVHCQWPYEEDGRYVVEVYADA